MLSIICSPINALTLKPSLLDPQQRLILECAAEALSLFSNGSTSKGAVGAYVGVV